MNVGNIEEQVELIRQVAKLYDELTDVTSKMNNCFALQTMFYMIAWIFNTIHGVFTFYRLVYCEPPGYEYLAYLGLVWLIYYALYLSAIVVVSGLLKQEGKATATLIHKAINLHWNPKVIDKLRTFSQQLGHRQPIVTCGLFPFDWSLFYSSIGLCVTYLAIMIQLDAATNTTQNTTMLIL
ncbi:hypothetical protein DMENIID0001_006830 [Sergentomyia squamirostris]